MGPLTTLVLTPAGVDRYTRRRPTVTTVWATITTVTRPPPPDLQIASHLATGYGFTKVRRRTDLPPSLPLFPGTPETRICKSSYRRYTGHWPSEQQLIYTRHTASPLHNSLTGVSAANELMFDAEERFCTPELRSERWPHVQQPTPPPA